MRKTHSSIRLVIAFLLVTIGVVFATCSCSPEVDDPPISEAIADEVSVADVTTTSIPTESTTEAVMTTSSATTVAHTEAATTTSSTTAKKTTTEAKPTTTSASKSTTTTVTTTTAKFSAVWGSTSEMKSDCIAMAQSLGYEYDSSLNKSTGHWITPTFSGAFTSSSR